MLPNDYRVSGIISLNISSSTWQWQWHKANISSQLPSLVNFTHLACNSQVVLTAPATKITMTNYSLEELEFQFKFKFKCQSVVAHALHFVSVFLFLPLSLSRSHTHACLALLLCRAMPNVS